MTHEYENAWPSFAICGLSSLMMPLVVAQSTLKKHQWRGSGSASCKVCCSCRLDLCSQRRRMFVQGWVPHSTVLLASLAIVIRCLFDCLMTSRMSPVEPLTPFTATMPSPSRTTFERF
mmetsp:Transcript_25083/g.48056  ORF Transcript_25083/g.48056 Transcript_25083/m.48056 type:complete len:118 (-) Transcript_25083:568-921(-)